MPVSVRRDPFATNVVPSADPRPNIDPFSGCAIDPSDLSLRLPQVRVLAALVPAYPDDPISEWPLVTRARLGARAGCSPGSGTITRALDGIRAGWTHGSKPHPGLLARGLVEVVRIDIDGISETNYRMTTAGLAAYRRHLADRGTLPQVKDRETCTNDRYREIRVD